MGLACTTKALEFVASSRRVRRRKLNRTRGQPLPDAGACSLSS